MRLHLAILSLLVVLPLVASGDAAAQGYGEQRTLQFRIQGYDRTTQEVYRRQFSSQAQTTTGGFASNGTVGASGLKNQNSSAMNNVVQYYDQRTTNVSLNGNNSTVSTGGVLNAGQTSADTGQVLNNQTDAAAGGAAAAAPLR
jgi:hypothetical protein